MESHTSENETSNLNRILSYVNQISLELATLPQGHDICTVITRKLKEATGAIGVTYGEYDSDNREIILKHIDTDSSIINTASKILGYSLINVRSVVTDKLYNEMLTEQVGVKNSLHEVTFGEIPQALSTVFMKTLNIKSFAGLAYFVEGKLYGTSVLAFKGDVPEVTMNLLRTLCNIIAVSLRRYKTELNLQQSIKALQISEEKFRNIAEQLSDTIFLTDTRGYITYLSPSSEQLFGFEPNEMLGKNFIKFIHKPDVNKTVSSFQIAISRSKDNEENDCLTLRMVRKNEEIFFGELVSRNLHEEGKISGTLGIIRDITDRIKTEQEIKSLNTELELRVQNRTSELETANKEMEAFSYSVSHDLRSPLRTISGFSSILLEENSDQLNEEGKLNLQRIINATHYMGQLIDDLLNLSRLHKAGIHPVEINLSNLVRAEFDVLVKREPERIAEIDIQENVVINGDKNLIQNAIQNLVNNAWKFTSSQKKTKIQFGTIMKDRKQVCFIKDNGVGFNMDYYSKLFNPFQRLHGRNEFPGTGIGLASVKRIVIKHNGEIWAESQLGKGASFYFYLGA